MGYLDGFRITFGKLFKGTETGRTVTVPYVKDSGPKREKPERLQGDRGYDAKSVRQLLRGLGITPVLAERNAAHGSGLGVFRWFVERTISWLHAFGRLRRRLDRLTEIQEAFLRLGCALICLRFLGP